MQQRIVHNIDFLAATCVRGFEDESSDGVGEIGRAGLLASRLFTLAEPRRDLDAHAARTALVAALTLPRAGTNVLVLDEPTNDLDLETLELLEQRLVDFQGTVLTVSHDREFLDHVVTSVIAFDQGTVQEYVGGYTDWIRQRGAVESAKESLNSPEKKTTTQSAPEQQKPKKLSYKEKRELEYLPAQIEQMEADIAELHETMLDASFYRRPAEEIASTQKSLQELESRVAAAYARWQQLEQIK